MKENEPKRECCERCKAIPPDRWCEDFSCPCHSTPTVGFKEEGTLKVSEFHCSEHGYIKPEPVCPKCRRTTLEECRQKTIEEIVKKVEYQIENVAQLYGGKTPYEAMKAILQSLKNLQ